MLELDPEKELELELERRLLNLSQGSRSRASPADCGGGSCLSKPEPSWAGQNSPITASSLCFSVKEGYKVRSDVNITLEFRTSSENGVLLGISSAKVDAIGLEIVNGKVGVLSPSGSLSPQCQKQHS